MNEQTGKPTTAAPRDERRGAPDGGSSINNKNNAMSAADLESLFNYPALGRLFDSAAAGGGDAALADMRARLASTIQNLERVIRQGSKQDADRAARIVQAYNTALAFLNELERLRDEPTKRK